MKKMKRFFSVFFLFSMLLGVKRGYLALWNGEDPQPVFTFPVTVSTLPPADQILLRRGIIVENPQSLQALLEDYL